MEHSALLERIKKLLALAQSSNPSEASIALSRAQKLMQEHNIDLQDIKLADIDHKEESILPALRDKQLFTTLASIISKSFGIEHFFNLVDGRGRGVTFIGPKARLEPACYAYTILSRQAAIVKKEFAAAERKRLTELKEPMLAELDSLQFRVNGDDFLSLLLNMSMDVEEMQEDIKKEINTEVRRNTKAYLYGWLRSIRDKVADFAVAFEEQKLIEQFMQINHPDLTPMRRRQLRFTQDQIDAYHTGVRDGRDGISLFNGIHGAASPRLFHKS